MADDPATPSESPERETTNGERDETVGVDDPVTDSEADETTAQTTPAEATNGEGSDAESETETDAETDSVSDDEADSVPDDVQKYARFKKMDGAQYDRVNGFLRDRTYITAREWAIARLCADFRTETGVEMTKIGKNLPRLVPFMTDTYTPQAVNQARSSFEGKVKKSGATFLYGAMSGFFTAEELDETMYEVTEIAKFLLEVEGVDLAVAEELDAEERISSVMREVRQSSAELRAEEVECPECGHVHEPKQE
ncbi:hypothetical protein AUR64_13110 [Haloprofundus marisrubri]|uniref:Uncharacterized protein n=1 Tax=Haloprofundus marisrubri TaxID=1514971 RepID=A0A0W1R5Y1_9EURY|nr:DUF5806 family protein [Haloprofundus marisrubri]KTG08761.1 hypothetical protein AUR64_13110 [Haloprofundus marisrubri]